LKRKLAKSSKAFPFCCKANNLKYHLFEMSKCLFFNTIAHHQKITLVKEDLGLIKNYLVMHTEKCQSLI
jgi:hypothetical protein